MQQSDITLADGAGGAAPTQCAESLMPSLVDLLTTTTNTGVLLPLSYAQLSCKFGALCGKTRHTVFEKPISGRKCPQVHLVTPLTPPVDPVVSRHADVSSSLFPLPFHRRHPGSTFCAGAFCVSTVC